MDSVKKIIKKFKTLFKKEKKQTAAKIDAEKEKFFNGPDYINPTTVFHYKNPNSHLKSMNIEKTN